MRVIRSKLDYVDTEYRVLAKLNGKTVGFIDKNLNGTYSYAFGRPKASYVSFNVDDLDTAKSRLEEHVFMGNSRRPIKSKNNIADINYYECPKCHEPQLYHGKNGIVCYNCGTKVSEDDLDKLKIWVSPHSKIKSSRKPIKSGMTYDQVLDMFTSEGKPWDDYWSMQQDWTAFVDSLERDGEVDYEEARWWDNPCTPKTFDEWVGRSNDDEYDEYYDDGEWDDEIESSRKPVQSGYEGDDAEAEELALYIKNTSELYHGITKSIIENLRKKARKGVYDKERAVDAWMYAADAGAKMYDKEFGSGRGSLTMFSKSSRRKAAEELARYYEENVLEGLDNVQSAFKIVSGKHTVEYSKPSREELEKVLDDFLAQKKVKFATDIYDDTVDYILTFWDEQDFKPRSVEEAVTDWYNDTKKHFPEDLKKISAAYHRWIKSKLIRSSRRMRIR
jgi:hypothetical protein